MPQTLPAMRRRLTQSFPRILCVACLCAIALGTRVVWAQSEADRATARNLAAEGYTALKTSDYSTAEDRFRRADALVHAPTLVVDHARALIGLGRLVEAQERLERILREGVSDNAPWVWKKSIEDAQGLLNEVKPKIAWLTITVRRPEGAKITVDGIEVPAVALGVRRATDPGQRRIRASAEGYLTKELQLGLPEGGERALTVELSRDPEANVSPIASPVSTAKPTNRGASDPTPERTKALPYAALGTAAVGMTVGTVAGIVALVKRAELVDKCGSDRKCDPSNSSLNNQYVTYGTLSGVGFTVGVIAGGLGLWLLLDSPKEPGTVAPKQARLVPYVTVNGGGLAGAF